MFAGVYAEFSGSKILPKELSFFWLEKPRTLGDPGNNDVNYFKIYWQEIL